MWWCNNCGLWTGLNASSRKTYNGGIPIAIAVEEIDPLYLWCRKPGEVRIAALWFAWPKKKNMIPETLIQMLFQYITDIT